MGFNGAQVIGDNMTGFNKPGLMAGLKVAFPFTEKLDASLALNYVQKGSRRTYDRNGIPQAGPNSWHLLRVHYVEIPILIHFKLPFFQEHVRGYLGLSGARQLGSYWEPQIGFEFPADYIRDYDFSYHYGATYIINEKWDFSVTNSHSLRSFDNSVTSAVLYRWRRGMFHNVLNFEFAYKF